MSLACWVAGRSRLVSFLSHPFCSRRSPLADPPLGHQILQWDFATANGVLLPDEYDPILESLRPFFALPPDEVGRRVAEAEQVPETYTLIVNEGGRVILQWNDRYSREKWVSSRPRSDHQINVMEPFVDDLTEMRSVAASHIRLLCCSADGRYPSPLLQCHDFNPRCSNDGTPVRAQGGAQWSIRAEGSL